MPAIAAWKWGTGLCMTAWVSNPLLDLNFRLGEGTGAAVAMELLDAATRVLCDIKTFEEVAIVDAQK